MSFHLGRGRGRGRGRGSSSPSTPPADPAANSPQYYVGSSSQFPFPPFSSVPESSPDSGHDHNQSSSSQQVPTTQEQQQRTLLLPDGQG
jgi:hypothetical protein